MQQYDYYEAVRAKRVMSKGVRFRTTIANLTERQRDNGPEGVERGACTKPLRRSWSPVVTTVAAHGFATWYSAPLSYRTLSGGTSSKAGLFSARTMSAKKPA